MPVGVWSKKLLDLIADALEIAVAEDVFDAIPQAVACQSQADRLPGAIVGPAQCGRERVAVIR